MASDRANECDEFLAVNETRFRLTSMRSIQPAPLDTDTGKATDSMLENRFRPTSCMLSHRSTCTGLGTAHRKFPQFRTRLGALTETENLIIEF
jgi:hypothetical protein